MILNLAAMTQNFSYIIYWETIQHIGIVFVYDFLLHFHFFPSLNSQNLKHYSFVAATVNSIKYFLFFLPKHQNIDGEINLNVRCDIWLDVKML